MNAEITDQAIFLAIANGPGLKWSHCVTPLHVKLNIPEVISRAMNGQIFWAQAALGWYYFLEDAQSEEGHSLVTRYTELKYFITLTNDGYLFFLTVVYFLIWIFFCVDQSIWSASPVLK